MRSRESSYKIFCTPSQKYINYRIYMITDIFDSDEYISCVSDYITI